MHDIAGARRAEEPGPLRGVPTPRPVSQGASAAPARLLQDKTGPRRGSAVNRQVLSVGVKGALVTGDLVALLAPLYFVGAADPVPSTVFVLLALLLLVSGGLYRPRLTLSVLDDAPQLLGRCLTAAALIAVVWGRGAVLASPSTTVLTLAALVAFKGTAYSVVRQLRRRGLARHPAIVLGAGDVGKSLVRTLQTHTELGLHPVGFLDDDPKAIDPQSAPVLGGTAVLAEAIRATGATVVIVAFGRRPESEMVHIIRTCDRLECTMLFVPRLFDIGAHGNVDHAWDVPLVRLRRTGLRTRPVLAAVALAVRVEVGRGVIFRQTRIGIDGGPFTIYRFRSLRDRNPARASTQWSVAGSLDVGPVGRVLRTTSLDELPQLCNVIRGDMSLVGPRPERPHFLDEFEQAHLHYMARHRLRSRLTGYAQVKGLRGNTSIADRLRFDNAYIENWSLWPDVKIMLGTMRSVIRGTGS